MNVQIAVAQHPNGSLFPCPQGPGVVEVKYGQGPQGKTAIICFMGFNQALATYDESGTHVVSYIMLNPTATLDVVLTVENIIRFITGNVGQ